jgi:hypothetical protein
LFAFRTSRTLNSRGNVTIFFVALLHMLRKINVVSCFQCQAIEITIKIPCSGACLCVSVVVGVGRVRKTCARTEKILTLRFGFAAPATTNQRYDLFFLCQATKNRCASAPLRDFSVAGVGRVCKTCAGTERISTLRFVFAVQATKKMQIITLKSRAKKKNYKILLKTIQRYDLAFCPMQATNSNHNVRAGCANQRYDSAALRRECIFAIDFATVPRKNNFNSTALKRECIFAVDFATFLRKKHLQFYGA